MFRKLESPFMVVGFLAILCASAHASPKCVKGQKPFRAFRGHDQLDYVHRSGIGMHPGASLVLHADLQCFAFEGSEERQNCRSWIWFPIRG